MAPACSQYAQKWLLANGAEARAHEYPHHPLCEFSSSEKCVRGFPRSPAGITAHWAGAAPIVADCPLRAARRAREQVILGQRVTDWGGADAAASSAAGSWGQPGKYRIVTSGGDTVYADIVFSCIGARALPRPAREGLPVSPSGGGIQARKAAFRPRPCALLRAGENAYSPVPRSAVPCGRFFSPGPGAADAPGGGCTQSLRRWRRSGHKVRCAAQSCFTRKRSAPARVFAPALPLSCSAASSSCAATRRRCRTEKTALAADLCATLAARNIRAAASGRAGDQRPFPQARRGSPGPTRGEAAAARCLRSRNASAEHHPTWKSPLRFSCGRLTAAKETLRRARELDIGS